MKTTNLLCSFILVLFTAAIHGQQTQVKPPDPKKGTIGLKLDNIRPDYVREYKLGPRQTGVLVMEVVPGSSGEGAGFMPGDVIVKINKLPVKSVRELMDERGKYKPGDMLELTAVRGKQSITRKLKIKPVA